MNIWVYFLLFLRRSVFNLVLCGWENIAMRLKWLAFSKDLKQEEKEPMINTKALLCYDLFCRWDSVWKTYACSLSHLGSDEPIDTNTVCLLHHDTLATQRDKPVWEKGIYFHLSISKCFLLRSFKKQTNKQNPSKQQQNLFYKERKQVWKERSTIKYYW